jgi:hypothetical protein
MEEDLRGGTLLFSPMNKAGAWPTSPVPGEEAPIATLVRRRPLHSRPAANET